MAAADAVAFRIVDPKSIRERLLVFDHRDKSSAESSEASISGEFRTIKPVSSGSDVSVVSGQALAEPQAPLLIKDYAVLESVDGDGLVLIGKNTRLVGEITNCSKVEIQGALDGTLIAESLVVREGGTVNGHITTTNATVFGTVDGEVVVDGLLDVKSTGKVTGDIIYGQFSVEIGGYISGQLNGPSQDEPDQLPIAPEAPPMTNGANGSGYEVPHFDDQEDSA